MTIAFQLAASPLLTYEQYMAEDEIVARCHIIDGVRTFMFADALAHLLIARVPPLPLYLAPQWYNDASVMRSGTSSSIK